MKSLQWRMLGALTLVIVAAWGISIAMFVSYLTVGPDNAWRSSLTALGNRLAHTLPAKWTWDVQPASAPSMHDIRPGKASPMAAGALKEPGSILTAMVLNTLELAIMGLLMWWAVIASLRPLRALSAHLAIRKAFEPEPLSLITIPVELRPLIGAFNSLLGRVDQAMQTERQFIADAAHELRTPLAALHVQAEVALAASTVSDKDQAIRKLLEVSGRTQRLADQLLDLARLDGGLHAPDLLPTDLFAICQHVVDEFSIQADERGTRLTLIGESCLARCDIDEIGIMLRNLVDNAIRHGRIGGNVLINCLYVEQADGRHPSIAVSDDGPGVPHAEHAAIFTRFYRGEGASARGSGIGLALVASVAELHNGRIEVTQPASGQGLSVRLLLPALT